MIGPLAVELGGRWTDRKDLRACPCRCRITNDERAKVIATIQKDGGHHHLPHGNRVPVQKTVTPIVMRLAELALSGDRFERFHFRIETEVATVDIDARACRLVRAMHDTAATPVGTIDPAVESAAKGVGPQLLGTGAESGPFHPPHISHSIAI